MGVVEWTVTAQGIMMAMKELFLWSALAFFALPGLIWLTKPKEVTAPGGGH